MLSEAAVKLQGAAPEAGGVSALVSSSAWRRAKASGPSLERYCCAESIHEALHDGAVKLVKGSYLCAHGRSVAGGLGRRQELPAEAFWLLHEVFHPGGKLKRQIVSFSYVWLTPGHPDPDGRRLRAMSRVIQQMISQHGNVAVFIDWCSLFQEPRSVHEQTAFERSLEHISLWFAHKLIIKVLLTKIPEEPSGSSGPTIASTSDATPWDYEDRGWPTFERRVSQFTFSVHGVLDLSKWDERCDDWEGMVTACKAERWPPVSSLDFSREIKRKHFTKSDDRLLLERRYHELFMGFINSTQKLDLRGLGWSDEQAVALAHTIRQCGKLRELVLEGNVIGPVGAERLAAALHRCGQLEYLNVQFNPLGPRGEKALQVAWHATRKPKEGLLLGSIGDNPETEEDESFGYQGPYNAMKQREGEGVLFDAAGFRYQGQFQQDLFHGDGIVTWPDGSGYSGQWENGQKSGDGQYTSPDGLKYVGQWRNGQRDGHGVQEYKDGGRYEGDWHHGMCSGRGTYHNPDGSTFKGQWMVGTYEGTGILYCTDGTCERQTYLAGKLMTREVLSDKAKLFLKAASIGTTQVEAIKHQERKVMHRPTVLPKLMPSQHIMWKADSELAKAAREGSVPPLAAQTARLRHGTPRGSGQLMTAR